jgi:hypothetical protein
MSFLVGAETSTSWGQKMKVGLRRKFPILGWFPLYTKEDGVADLIAGVTVGLTVVPQSIAYAAIAGLSPQVTNTTGNYAEWELRS